MSVVKVRKPSGFRVQGAEFRVENKGARVSEKCEAVPRRARI
jgi:hypothetical protein